MHLGDRGFHCIVQNVVVEEGMVNQGDEDELECCSNETLRMLSDI
jgi:hypothetical protein